MLYGAYQYSGREQLETVGVLVSTHIGSFFAKALATGAALTSIIVLASFVVQLRDL